MRREITQKASFTLNAAIIRRKKDDGCTLYHNTMQILHSPKVQGKPYFSVFVPVLTALGTAYLLLVSQGRALISFLRSNRMKLEDEIIRLKELCSHMDIIFEKLRRRPLFL